MHKDIQSIQQYHATIFMIIEFITYLSVSILRCDFNYSFVQLRQVFKAFDFLFHNNTNGYESNYIK
ncbi:hypothetical protein IV02_04620 [Pseudomonas syringae]|uniref:Uncharacterized protein n=1 Tax=Pseudomonas syringae TaxID=317 RepID=A0A085VF22_PSESX|nr:hypothetical protein IV02_04620 [Pseudomonas syringae]